MTEIVRGLKKAKPFLAVIFLQFGNAGMSMVAKFALNQGMSQHVLVVYRHAIATLFIAPFAFVFDRKVRPKMTVSTFLKILLLALLEPTIDQNLFYTGMKYTTATFASAMCNVLPAFAFLMAWICRVEKVKIRETRSQAKILGTMVTVGGAMVMTLVKGPILGLPWSKINNRQFQSASALLIKQDPVKGALMMAIGCLCWARFFVLQAITLESYPAELSLTTLICFMGTIEGAIFALAVERGNPGAWSIHLDSKLFAAVYSISQCINFYEPYNPRPYTRSIVLAVPSRHFVGYPTIQDSKFGWLLVSVPHYKSRLFSPIAYYSQFVYHPFSDVSLDLPDLYSKGLDMATFSGSDPTSEDCVFFVLVQKKYPDTTMEIHIWTQDQEAWKKHEFETGQYWGFDKNMAYVDEIFYCLSMPHMGSFNPSSGEWREIALPSQICDVDLCFINVRLFELNGKILLLMFNSPYTMTEKVAERNHVLFKFDPFEDAWIKRDGFLNDRVLFISYTNPSCYSILAKGQAEKMGNKVYTNYSSYPDDDGDMLLRQFYGLSWLAP